jgi:hypothetical protein
MKLWRHAQLRCSGAPCRIGFTCSLTSMASSFLGFTVIGALVLMLLIHRRTGLRRDLG